MTKQLLMIAGGGTGGHIYPAIAIAKEYLAASKDRDVVFVGTEYGLEKNIVPKAGFKLEFLSIGGIKGKSLARTIQNVFRIPMSLIGAWRLLSKYKPDAVLGVGGYASGPLLMAAAMRRIPTLIHEANAYPGLTNRILARFVRQVAVAFPEALPRMKRQGVVTGNPIRAEFFAASPKQGRERVRLLVFGGSQGSRVINTAVTDALLFLAPLKDRLDIVHQTGPADHERVATAYRSSAFSNARVTPYIDNMAEELAAADLVVSRSGAMTVGELSAVGRAAILVPFAAATNDHQHENAKVLEAAGGAIVITERELTGERMAGAINSVLADPQKPKTMGEALKRLSSPEASRKIVQLIDDLQRKQLN